MIDIYLAVDDEDITLGVFFTECSEDLIGYFNSIERKVIALNTRRLNKIAIEASLKDLNSFMFLAYSHEFDSELLVGGNLPYINIENSNLFSDSFFYSCSCNSSKILENSLIDSGCLSFIGYNNKFTIWDYNRLPFVECANYGIKLFYEGFNSLTIVLKMKEKYNYHIDNYKNDMFGAAILVSNSIALRHLGKNISIRDLVA